MNLVLSIKWNNFILLESGVPGGQSITNGKFSLWCSWAKFAEEKKITQIKPQEYPSSLKKEQILKLWIEIE